MNLNSILGDPEAFVKSLIAELGQVGIDIGKNTIDHLCYKPETYAEYEKLKMELEKVGELLAEAIINKRPIATYELFTPLIINGFAIPLIELAAPKPGVIKKSHFEHFEVVLKDESLIEFKQKHRALDWDSSKIQDIYNPDITVKLNSGLVKFHPESLKVVIARENARR
jgi:predicted metalloenzyme YecM